jgi:hypothetical protein
MHALLTLATQKEPPPFKPCIILYNHPPFHHIRLAIPPPSRPLNPNTLPPLPHKRPIALLICPPSTESQPDQRRPRPPLEHQNREDDAEGQTERRPDQERRETMIPLQTS